MKQIITRLIVAALAFIVGIAPHTLYHRHLFTQEQLLKENLFQMRREIDRYTAEKSKLPVSLDDLVQAGYIREIPVDPITGRKDWFTIGGDDPYEEPTILPKISSRIGSNTKDVRSASTEISSKGTRYIEW